MSGRSGEGFADALHPKHYALPVGFQQHCSIAPLELVWVPAQQLRAQPPLVLHSTLHKVDERFMRPLAIL
jgi:hypothetical protein